MVIHPVKPRKRFYLPILSLLAFLLISLHLMSTATQETSELNRMYSWLLLINSLTSLLLLGLVSANGWWLFRQFRKNSIGSRLTVRIVLLFITLSLAPSGAVFYYSMQFLHRSIDSWFDVQIDQAMDEALQLSQASLDERMRNLLKQTELVVHNLDAQSETLLAIELDDLRARISASELTLFSKSRQVIAYSSSSPDLVPYIPNDSTLLQLRNGEPFVGLEPGESDTMAIQVVVQTDYDNTRFLHALYPVSSRIGSLANSIEAAYAHYKERTYLRDSLKFTFSLTLSLILLLSLLATIWIAFVTSRRIVAPVRELALGTQAVAEGDYTQQLSIPGQDELGFLVESFNEMTRRIAHSRHQADQSQHEVESQRNYLETILTSLSTGVISFDVGLNIKSANRAACKILHLDESALIDQPLQQLSESSPNISRLINTIQSYITQNEERWQKECTVLGDEGRQLLMIRGVPLYNHEQIKTGSLIIFDDVTTLVQAQRNAAWGEVARRLAHEIKNPLTPIQLSAERLKHKLSRVIDGANAELLNRSTHTIVQQVEAMKAMVNEFADYARPPSINAESIDLASLIKEIISLYGAEQIHLKIIEDVPPLSADPLRIRQVFHNLIKNSLEASCHEAQQRIDLTLKVTQEQGKKYAQITVEDNGSGLTKAQFDTIFDPYVTTKKKGTGLGLSIVKKIIDEHGGIIWADPTCQTGARFIFRLPYSQLRRTVK